MDSHHPPVDECHQETCLQIGATTLNFEGHASHELTQASQQEHQ